MTLVDENESEDDVWEAVIIQLGGYKNVAMWLWPHLKQETAYARLKNCFRDDKDERLNWEDRKRILHRARDAGFHQLMHRLCDDLLYERTNPANKERVLSELKNQAGVTIGRLESLIERMEKLEGNGK